MPSSTVYDVEGRRCRVRDTLADYLLVIELLQDGAVSDRDRFELLVLMSFADPAGAVEAYGERIPEALDSALWQAFGIDLGGDRYIDGRRIVDWESDRSRIVATARAAYSLSWQQLTELPYSEAIDLMGLAPHDTPMGQAVYYRVADEPDFGKGEDARRRRDAWRRQREHYRLRS